MLTFETTETTEKANLPLCRTECPYLPRSSYHYS